MLVVDAPRPVAAQVAFQRFGLASAGEGRALALLQQRVDFAQNGAVRFLLVEILLPSSLVP